MFHLLLWSILNYGFHRCVQVKIMHGENSFHTLFALVFKSQASLSLMHAHQFIQIRYKYTNCLNLFQYLQKFRASSDFEYFKFTRQRVSFSNIIKHFSSCRSLQRQFNDKNITLNNVYFWNVFTKGRIRLCRWLWLWMIPLIHGRELPICLMPIISIVLLSY